MDRVATTRVALIIIKYTCMTGLHVDIKLLFKKFETEIKFIKIEKAKQFFKNVKYSCLTYV